MPPRAPVKYAVWTVRPFTGPKLRKTAAVGHVWCNVTTTAVALEFGSHEARFFFCALSETAAAAVADPDHAHRYCLTLLPPSHKHDGVRRWTRSVESLWSLSRPPYRYVLELAARVAPVNGQCKLEQFRLTDP